MSVHADMATVVVSVNASAEGGTKRQVSTFWSQKKWELKQFCERKNDCFNFDAANVIIGVYMKFEKGFNWGCRDTFPALIITPFHHTLEN